MKTKKIYELSFRTNKSTWCNVLFGSRKRAEEALNSTYSVGSVWIEDEIIEDSFISCRTLF